MQALRIMPLPKKKRKKENDVDDRVRYCLRSSNRYEYLQSRKYTNIEVGIKLRREKRPPSTRRNSLTRRNPSTRRIPSTRRNSSRRNTSTRRNTTTRRNLSTRRNQSTRRNSSGRDPSTRRYSTRQNFSRRNPSTSQNSKPLSPPNCYECPYQILQYKVPRQDYGRLEYNAEIAHRIHSKLLDVDLDVPDIVTAKHFDFFVLAPTTFEYQKLVDVKDVTKEWSIQEKKRTRWIILFAENTMSIELPKKSEKIFLGKPEDNLKKNPEVCKFLTFSFENEIFAYAERALHYVVTSLQQKLEHEQEILGFTKLEILSLLSRKLPEHDTSPLRTTDKQSTVKDELKRLPFELISEALQDKSMQDCSIRGYCNTVDGFLVFVDKQNQDAAKKGTADRIKKQIENCLQKWLLKPKIVWVENLMTTDLSAQGCELENTESESKGTLGCYGKDAGNSVIAITAGHFVKENQKVYKTTNGTQKKFGKCGQSHYSNDADIAVINVYDDMKPSSPRLKFYNEKDEVCNASVYRRNDIRNWPVYKKGAKTGWTSGVTYCDEANVCEEKGILITGNGKDAFAEEGDSGSIVFFHDPEDINDRNVYLLSIVSKEIILKTKGAIPVGLSRKPTLTRSLKDGLDKVPNIEIPYQDD